MAIRLPVHAARRLFYTQVTVYETAPGEYINGIWNPGEPTRSVIAGSFQPPTPLKLDIGITGDFGMGERSLWTTADLPFYDINSRRQSWIRREGMWWRLTDRKPWDSYVSMGLFVYALERYHQTEEGGGTPPETP